MTRPEPNRDPDPSPDPGPSLDPNPNPEPNQVALPCRRSGGGDPCDGGRLGDIRGRVHGKG